MATKTAVKRKKRIDHTVDFKLQIVREIQAAGGAQKVVADRHGLNDSMVHRWMKEYRDTGTIANRYRGSRGAVAQPAAPPAPVKRKGGELNRKYSTDFKTKAVAKTEGPNAQTVEVVSEALGIGAGVLYHWRRNMRLHGSPEAPRSTPSHKKNRQPAPVTAAPSPGNGTPQPTGDRTDGRLQAYIKSDREHLLAIIGSQTVELMKLRAK